MSGHDHFQHEKKITENNVQKRKETRAQYTDDADEIFERIYEKKKSVRARVHCSGRFSKRHVRTSRYFGFALEFQAKNWIWHDFAAQWSVARLWVVKPEHGFEGTIHKLQDIENLNSSPIWLHTCNMEYMVSLLHSSSTVAFGFERNQASNRALIEGYMTRLWLQALYRPARARPLQISTCIWWNELPWQYSKFSLEFSIFCSLRNGKSSVY